MNGSEIKAVEKLLETHVGYVRDDIATLGRRITLVESASRDPERVPCKTLLKTKDLAEKNEYRISVTVKLLLFVGSIALTVFGAWIKTFF